jgi:hypothetical protein
LSIITELSFFPKELWSILDSAHSKSNVGSRKKRLQLAKLTDPIDVDDNEDEEMGDVDSVKARKLLKEKQIQRINAVGTEEDAAEEDLDEQSEDVDYDFNYDDDEMEGDYGENHFDNGEGDYDDGDGAGDEGGDFM